MVIVVTSCVTSHLLFFLRTIHYYAELGQRSVFPTCEVPEHFVGQVTVLKYFSHYMEENLMDVSKNSSFSSFISLAVIFFLQHTTPYTIRNDQVAACLIAGLLSLCCLRAGTLVLLPMHTCPDSTCCSG